MAKVIKRKIVKSDSVYVIAGKDRGKIGKILKVIKGSNSTLKVVVSGVNMVNVVQKDASGSKIVRKEFAIDISNVLYFDSVNNVYGRVGFKFVDGKKVRYCKSSQKVVG